MDKQQKPEWITGEQWEANPNIYHWKQSLEAMESLEQLQNQLTYTKEEVIQQHQHALRNAGLSTKDFDSLHKYGTNTGQLLKTETLNPLL